VTQCTFIVPLNSLVTHMGSTVNINKMSNSLKLLLLLLLLPLPLLLQLLQVLFLFNRSIFLDLLQVRPGLPTVNFGKLSEKHFYRSSVVNANKSRA